MKKTINGYRVELLIQNHDALVRPRMYFCRGYEVDGTIVTLDRAEHMASDGDWKKQREVVLVNTPVRIVAHSWETGK